MFIIQTNIDEDNSIHSIVYGGVCDWKSFKEAMTFQREGEILDVLHSGERNLKIKTNNTIVNFTMVTDSEFATPVGFWLSENKDTTANKAILKLLKE